MFNALFAIPVKALLYIAGALFTLNFATFVTKHFNHHDHPPIIAERIACQGDHAQTVTIRVGQLAEERATKIALENLLNDHQVQAELEEMAKRVERIQVEAQQDFYNAMAIYR